MDRTRNLSAIKAHVEPFDIAIIGGGATGASIALDAATRGLKTVLFEQRDFGQGTSSRSTKLVHGGVRYLAQGNIRLVREALKERARLRQNAPHVVSELSFVLPCDSVIKKWWYRVGFILYDLLAGKSNFHRARLLSSKDCIRLVPSIDHQMTKGGVLYSDGQFDDCRLLINILQTACENGALVVNYAKVESLEKDSAGKITGLRFVDAETQCESSIRARCVINATGPFCDALRTLDDPDARPMVTASQGIHIVFPKRFFAGETAMIIPKTSDGRVLFAIPWHEHVVVGTTDTPIPKATLEPRPLESEIEFLLETIQQYLNPAPKREDILSVFTGIRPLVSPDSQSKGTASISRDHTLEISPSQLITITGGKWTTARKMAEDCVDRASAISGLKPALCKTQNLAIHGAPTSKAEAAIGSIYGNDWPKILELQSSIPAGSRPIVQGHSLTAGQVIWHVRHEMARTIEDILARRDRMLFLNARSALAAAPRVASLMAEELGYDSGWENSQVTEFSRVAELYSC